MRLKKRKRLEKEGNKVRSWLKNDEEWLKRLVKVVK